jgi:hypothetical protein
MPGAEFIRGNICAESAIKKQLEKIVLMKSQKKIVQFSCLIMLAILTVLIPMAAAEGAEFINEADIIPAPKIMAPPGGKFVLCDRNKPMAMIVMDKNDREAVVAAREINGRIKELGGEPLPTGTDGRSAAVKNMIILGSLQSDESGVIPNDQEIKDISSKGAQGYVIRFGQTKKGGRAAGLYGAEGEGLLYAGSTFRLLIKREGSTIFATEARITDWPDFTYRGLPVWPLPSSFEDFKKYVDWALRYKFNRIYTAITSKKTADDFKLPTSEERLYLRKINAYAKERGILINYALNWAVGSMSPGGTDDDYKGSVLFNNHYYSWSENGLLKKRAKEIAEYAGEIGAGSLLFHCIDTHEESWDKRGKKDRERYGNDRASADANVINIFTEEIRRLNPGIELQFVVSPYHANLDLAGNEQYKAWMKSLTALIPNDVYLVVAELNRDQENSWVATARQPLAHWINGDAFQWGRYFSTLPAFTKTAFHEGRNRDIVVHMEPIGFFNGEVMQLVAAEYEWNVNAPGSGYITEDRAGKPAVAGGNLHNRNETVNGENVNSWGWYHGTAEPKPTAGNLLLKACRLEFGQAAAPYMADFFRNNPVGWRGAALFSGVLRDVMTGKEADASWDQLDKTNKALTSLKNALSVASANDPVHERIKYYIRNTYRQNLVISGAEASYRAKQFMLKGSRLEAGNEIGNGRNRLAGIRREMENGGYWSDESREWYAEGERLLNMADTGMRKVHSPNLIKNPGFEERSRAAGVDKRTLPSWSAAGTLQLTGDSHSGTDAANLKLKPSDTHVYMEQSFDVAAGCEAYVEFWLKKEGEFRVIPILQYWNEDHTKKVETVAADDFTFNAVVGEYRRYYGKVRLPRYVRQAVFKVFADWYGFTPTQEKNLFLDDVFVGCDPTQEKVDFR